MCNRYLFDSLTIQALDQKNLIPFPQMLKQPQIFQIQKSVAVL